MISVVLMNDELELLNLICTRLCEEGTITCHTLTWDKLGEAIELSPDLFLICMTTTEEQRIWDLIERLRMRKETASIPIILCPLYSPAMEDMKGFLRQKKILLVYRPLDLDEVLNAIQQAISSPTPERVSAPLQKPKRAPKRVQEPPIQG